MKPVLFVIIATLATFHAPAFGSFATFGFGKHPSRSCEESLRTNGIADVQQNQTVGNAIERFRAVREEFRIQKNSIADQILKIMQNEHAVSQRDTNYAEFNRLGGACGPTHLLNLLSAISPRFARTPTCMTEVMDGIAGIRKKDPREGTNASDIEAFLNYSMAKGDLPKLLIRKVPAQSLEMSPRSVVLLGVRTGWDQHSPRHWLLVLAVKNSRALVVDSNFPNEFDVAEIASTSSPMTLISDGFTNKLGDRFVYPQDEVHIELQ